MSCDQPWVATSKINPRNFDITFRINETDRRNFVRSCSFFVMFDNDTAEYYELMMHSDPGKACAVGFGNGCVDCVFTGKTAFFSWDCVIGSGTRTVLIDNIGPCC